MSHRIHSVSPEGPVGQTGKVFPGDFLLEANGINVLEMTHPEVVKLIQTLPRNIRLIVARFSSLAPASADEFGLLFLYYVLMIKFLLD